MAEVKNNLINKGDSSSAGYNNNNNNSNHAKEARSTNVITLETEEENKLVALGNIFASTQCDEQQACISIPTSPSAAHEPITNADNINSTQTANNDNFTLPEHATGAGQYDNNNNNNDNNNNTAEATFFSESSALFTPHQWQARIICKSQLCTLHFDKKHDELRITRVNRHGRELTLLKVNSNFIVNMESANERVSRQLGRRANDDVVRSGFHHHRERLSLLCVCPAIAYERSRASVENKEQPHLDSKQSNSRRQNILAKTHNNNSNSNSSTHDRTYSSNTQSANNVYFDNGNAAAAAIDAAFIANNRCTKTEFSSFTNAKTHNSERGREEEKGTQLLTRPCIAKTSNSSTYAKLLSQKHDRRHVSGKNLRYYLHYVRLHNEHLSPTIHTIEFSCVEDKEHHTLEFKALMLALLRRVYSSGVKNVRVYISPTSGKGDGVEVFATEVYPVLHFSRHNLITHITTRPHDCEDRLADLTTPLNEHDVIVAAGGDGMIHEVVNGLHRRKVAIMNTWRERESRRKEEEQQQQEEEWWQQPEEEREAREKETREREWLQRESNATTNVNISHYQNSSNNKDEELNDCKFTSCTLVNKSPFSSSTGSVLTKEVTLPECLKSLHLHFDPHEVIHRSKKKEVNVPLRGWEELMPLVATIPTGSACGMAKSMDVITTIDAALALIHLHTCEMDLLQMRFSANEDMINFHKKKLSNSAYVRATQKFNDYKRRYARELGIHSHNKAAKLSITNHNGTSHDNSISNNNNNNNNNNNKNNYSNNNGLTLTNTICRHEEEEEEYESSSTSQSPPYLRDGTGVYQDAVSFHVKAPFLRERVAFMSLSFGMANDIDHGSEHLRWMGNARFAVYGGIMILRGPQVYRATLRYLPWDDAVTGLRVEKLHKGDKMPHPSQLPPCTMRRKCPHCERHDTLLSSPWARSTTSFNAHSLTSPLLTNNTTIAAKASPLTNKSNCGIATFHDNNSSNNNSNNNNKAETTRRRYSTGNSCETFNHNTNTRLISNTFNDGALFGEDEVDFDDLSLPWVTIEGDFYNLLLCNVKDVARDVLIAPIAHLSDGAIDIVFSRKDSETSSGSRKEFLQFFLSLEKGKHVEFEFTNYVKARAAEVKVDHGISMSDGEMMPLSTVRVTKLRQAVRFVRSE